MLSSESIASVIQQMFQGELRKTFNRKLISVDTRPSNGSLQLHEIAVIDSSLGHEYHADAAAN